MPRWGPKKPDTFEVEYEIVTNLAFTHCRSVKGLEYLIKTNSTAQAVYLAAKFRAFIASTISEDALPELIYRCRSMLVRSIKKEVWLSLRPDTWSVAPLSEVLGSVGSKLPTSPLSGALDKLAAIRARKA